MFAFFPDIQDLRQHWLEPAAQELLLRAEDEARQLGWSTLSLEQVVLTVCADTRMAPLLEALQLDIATTRLRLQSWQTRQQREGMLISEPHQDQIVLEYNLLECLASALAVVIYPRRALLLTAEHLMLSVLSSQKMYFLLRKLMPERTIVLQRLAEYDPVRQFDAIFLELIAQNTASVTHRYTILQTLQRSSHPMIRFADVQGYYRVKQEIQAFIAPLVELRTPEEAAQPGVYTFQLIGSASVSRRRLVEAIAGELGCPLLTLSIPAFLPLLALYTTYEVDANANEHGGFVSSMKSLTPFGLQLIQALLHQGLNTLRRRSPMVFCLEDLDAFAHPPSQTMREQLLRFLLAEIQKLSERDGKVLILALAQEQQALDHLLGSLQTPLFRDRISMEEVQGQPRQSSLEATAHCPSCQRPADPSWKHCAYCGDVLARACPNCGYLQPAGEDVRFCFECGYQFG